MALANTSLAIGAVTRLLADHLNRRTSYPVNTGRPEASTSVNTRTLNLFLYEAVFDPSLKNHPLAEGQRPPIWLTLKYLLTGFDETANSDTADAHEVLGQGVSALQELTFLGLDTAVAPAVASALEDNPEPLKLTFDECSVDLLNKILQASDDEYRLSIAFQVRPVMIVPPERPSFNLLVGVDYTATPTALSAAPVAVAALGSLGPRLAALTPPSFALGEEFEITGEDLHLANLDCQLGPVVLGLTGQSPDRVRVRVDPALGSGTQISAGEHPVTLRQFVPATGRYRTSNLLAGRLVPSLDSVAVGGLAADVNGNVAATLTFAGRLLGRNEDAILVALYRDGAVARMFDIVKPLPGLGDPPDDQQSLTLAILFPARVRPGAYQVILVVNGSQARQSPTINLVPP